MTLNRDEIFIVPSEAAELVRSQVQAGDTLMILRPNVAPMKIKISDTGLLNRTTIGEPIGEVLEGDKKIVNKEEFTYIGGEWVRSSKVIFTTFTAADKAESDYIPLLGEPIFISDEYYLVVGNGVTKLKDLLSIFARPFVSMSDFIDGGSAETGEDYEFLIDGGDALTGESYKEVVDAGNAFSGESYEEVVTGGTF